MTDSKIIPPPGAALDCQEYMPLSLSPMADPNFDDGEHWVLDAQTAYVFRLHCSRDRAERIIGTLNAAALAAAPAAETAPTEPTREALDGLPAEEVAGKTATRLLDLWSEIEGAENFSPYQETMAFLGKPNSVGWVWAHEVRFERDFDAEQEKTRRTAIEVVTAAEEEAATLRAALIHPAPAAGAHLSRDEIKQICWDLASQNMTPEAAERQADRISGAIEARLHSPAAQHIMTEPNDGIEPCERCGGSGWLETIKCPNCGIS